VDVQQLSGKTIGQYELRELLGAGGMGAVYHAYQSSLDRHVAIKILSEQLGQVPNHFQRFMLEARTAASLEHPHIVPIYDYGTHEGLNYIVMRLLSGGSLAQRLDFRLHHENTLPALGETSELLKQIAGALDYAHERHVIHRDIKTSNIMFDGQGAAYLVDFGIARLLQSNISLTQEGMTLGTPEYMPPEQWRDEQLTSATDQYMLGVVIYLMVTGRMPFDGQTYHALMYSHLDESPPSAQNFRADLPEAVAHVLDKTLAKLPEERYTSVGEFSRAFNSAVQGVEGMSTKFFAFKLPSQLPAIPVEKPSTPKPVSADTVHSAVVPEMQLTQPAKTVVSQVAPVQAEEDQYHPPAQAVAIPQPRNQNAPKRNNYDSFIVGAGIGVVLLAVVIIILMFAVKSLLDGNNDSNDAVGAAPTQVVEITAESIQLTPLVTPIPGITAIAQINPITVGTSLLNPQNANAMGQLNTFQSSADTEPYRSVAFSPNRAWLAGGRGDAAIYLWNLSDGSQRRLLAHSDVVYGLDFSPDNTTLASAGGDGLVILWDVTTGNQISILQGHTSLVRDVAFSPDGQLVASASEDQSVRLWNVATGQQQRVLNGHTARVLSVAFSPDGLLLASAGSDGLIILWDVATGSQHSLLRGHSEEVRMIAFSPDGTRLASGSTDNTAHIWEVATGTILQTLTEHGRDVFSVSFSPDGQLLATGGRDNTIRLYDVQSGQQLTVLEGHAGWVFDLEFTTDGTMLASAGGDSSIRLWGLPN